jgi:CrcB protein
MKLFWIGAGGAFGSVARFLLDGWVQRLVPGDFPLGILVVNALGSFAIGFSMTLLEARGMLDSTLRLGLVAGVLGGFTTYSSFNYQTLELLRARDWTGGALNLAGTVGLCLVAGLAGLAAGRWLAAA